MVQTTIKSSYEQAPREDNSREVEGKGWQNTSWLESCQKSSRARELTPSEGPLLDRSGQLQFLAAMTDNSGSAQRWQRVRRSFRRRDLSGGE